MLENALPRFKTQVQAIELGITPLQPIDHTQALQVVLKPTELCHAGMERILPCVAKGRMP